MSKSTLGMTLVEIMVSVAVFTIVAAMTIGAFIAGYRMMFFTRMLELAHTDVRNAVDRIGNFQRQAIYYSSVFSNGVASSHLRSPYNTNVVQSGGVNTTNIITNSESVYIGNEVRIMYKGAVSKLAQIVTNGSTSIYVSNNLTISSVSTIPTVFNTIPSTGPSPLSGNVRTTEQNYQPSAWDSILFPSYPIPLVVTNVDNSTSGIIRYDLLNPVTNVSSSVEMDVYVGTVARFIVSNQQLLFYSDMNPSSSPDVLLDNISFTQTNDTFKVFGVTKNANYQSTNSTLSTGDLTIDLQFTSPGDITGKGIYRIITTSTMRTNPQAGKAAAYGFSGANTAPDFGAD